MTYLIACSSPDTQLALLRTLQAHRARWRRTERDVDAQANSVLDGLDTLVLSDDVLDGQTGRGLVRAHRIDVTQLDMHRLNADTPEGLAETIEAIIRFYSPRR